MEPIEDSRPLMKVSADISRRDLLVFKLYSLPRVKANWACWAIMMLLAFGMFRLAEYTWPIDDPGYNATAVAAILAFVVSSAGMVAGVAVNLALSLLFASEKSGVLGPRVFTLRGDGFHEQTAVNEGLHRWQGLYSIEGSKSYLYIGISWLSYHIVPARAFDSRAEFERFSRLARELWIAAR